MQKSMTLACSLLVGLLLWTPLVLCERFFIDESRNIFKESGKVELSDPVAWADYRVEINQTGWNYLTIETSQNFNDNTQMFHAGFLEGYLTQDTIYDAYLNYVDSVMNKNSTLPWGAQQFIENQNNWMKAQIANNPRDPYWNLVDGHLNQLKGMYEGYVSRVIKEGRLDQMLDFNHFYYLTNMGDLEDIQPAFTPSSNKGRLLQNEFKFDPNHLGECSGYVKLVNGNLISAHTTFNIFTLMLRIFKNYIFHLNNELNHAVRMSFSSRPGDLESKDDFYEMSSDLVVMETSLNTYNTSLYSKLKPETVPTWLRANLANRAAKNASDWAYIFSLYNSGTHNNQWLVIDYRAKRLQDEKKLATAGATFNNLRGRIAESQSPLENIVWMVEQYYDLMKAEDVTQTLLQRDGYIASYNVPYDKEIYEISGYKTGYGFNYDNDPRAILFRDHQQNVTSIEDVKKLIRYNKNETGNPCNSIAPRCDLNTKGAFYFGSIDGKVLDESTLKVNKVWIISSPPNDDLPPFSFSGAFADAAHRGIPSLMNFSWMFHEMQTE